MKSRWFIISLSLFIIAVIFASDGCIKRRDMERERQMRGRSIEQVFDSHRDRLLSIPGVVGAGIAKTDDMPAIMVMVLKRTTELETMIPEELDGYPVIIEVTGEFKANDSL